MHFKCFHALFNVYALEWASEHLRASELAGKHWRRTLDFLLSQPSTEKDPLCEEINIRDENKLAQHQQQNKANKSQKQKCILFIIPKRKEALAATAREQSDELSPFVYIFPRNP